MSEPEAAPDPEVATVPVRELEALRAQAREAADLDRAADVARRLLNDLLVACGYRAAYSHGSSTAPIPEPVVTAACSVVATVFQHCPGGTPPQNQ